MTTVVDKRLNGKNKSATNRSRFIKRYKKSIKERFSDELLGGSITDGFEGGLEVDVGGISEPFIGHSSHGDYDKIMTGNDQFDRGDKIARPKGGGGGGGSKAGDGGEDDSYYFTLTKDELKELLFEDLELPEMTKKKVTTEDTAFHRAGFKTTGTSSALDVVRSMRNAYGRKIAFGKGTVNELQVAHDNETDEDKKAELLIKLEEAKSKVLTVPFLDPLDLRYRNIAELPAPGPRAVMFCIMDVSSSMTEELKKKAKTFFLLTHLFLTTKYSNVEVVFIVHNTEAHEVTEKEFFYSRLGGGTRVESALTLTAEVIKERYSADEWNIYGIQISDGDTWDGEERNCVALLKNEILPLSQYFVYVEILDYDKEHQVLWNEYLKLLISNKNFNMEFISEKRDLYKSFRNIFAKG